jgi:TrpR-related protein YerC/YecD
LKDPVKFFTIIYGYFVACLAWALVYADKRLFLCRKGCERMAYKSRLAGKEADLLCDAVLALQNREECYRFFEDLLTTGEFTAMSQRIAVARMLYNEEKYNDIAEETGASTATISRVKRCVNYGADGYLLVLKRLEDEPETEKTDTPDKSDKAEKSEKSEKAEKKEKSEKPHKSAK